MKIWKYMTILLPITILMVCLPVHAQDESELDDMLDAPETSAEEADAEESEDGESAGEASSEEAAEEEEGDDLDAMLGEMDEEAAEADEETEAEADEEEEADSEEADESATEEEDAVEAESEETGEDRFDPRDVDAEELGLSPKELERQMVIQRQAAEEEGKKTLEDAKKSLEEGNERDAIQGFSDALVKIPERPATDAVRQEAREGLVRAYYEQAVKNLKRNNFDDARDSLEEAESKMEGISSEFRERMQNDIKKLRRDIDKEEEKYEAARTPEAREIRRLESEEEEVDDLIDSGKEMLSRGDYNEAEKFFKEAQSIDSSNRDVLRLLRKVEEERYEVSSIKRETTVEDMIQEVRESWNPPADIETRSPERGEGEDEKYTKTETQELREKMEDIIIPSIEFRQANIVDVISFLRDASEAADEEDVGVNIILKLPSGESVSAGSSGSSSGGGEEEAVGDDIWGDFEEESGGRDEEDEGAVGGISSIPTITLNLRRVSLMDAIQYVTEVADLKFRLEGNVVIITPADMPTGKIVTKMYPVQPSFLDVVVTREEERSRRSGGGGGGQFIEMGEAETGVEKTDVKEFFENSGVQFPQGTSITYNSSISQLIVSNTPENLELFERILAQLNVVPRQVQIEARFVEVAQNDLEELGFEWLLDDNYEMLVKDGSAPVGGRERVVMNENASTGGFTQGMRFFAGTESGTGLQSASTGPVGGMGGILGISSILTNPEVSMVLHALDQKGGVDLLSAPRVTTRSGVNAEIKVVREIIYPTEFDMETQTVDVGGGTGGVSRQTQTVVTPDGFETRETGVIMNVTPTVGPDGYTIDLSMVPEVAELVDWIDYGTSDIPIPQPVFSSRNVTTSIVIWDGQTVVMGGMIREQLTSVDDKIPLLGSIPLVGRLFRNKGEYSKKQNLLIFVTARLVDPAGNRIHNPEDVQAELPAAQGRMQQGQEMPTPGGGN